MPAKKNTARRKLHALDLLCRAGTGIAPIAPAACRQIRELVGADAASIFWLDENGLPQGFFHEDSPESARDLFVNEFERLFIGPAELNVTALARTPGPRVGRIARPGKAYFSSNTFNLLVRASGHHHSLDLRIDLDGRARRRAAVSRRSTRFRDDRRGRAGTGHPLFAAGHRLACETTSLELQRKKGTHADRCLRRALSDAR
ncbi:MULTISPECIES: hypothetical protein [unclassified Methylosinus]|uniref:hypothetical protein n=1 Tax=unclassified Methylosinus TaxID=2624500 RepID=UPI0004AE26B1|nr:MULTISPECIES: hypothetical protein [unclassified Methylosinus]